MCQSPNGQQSRFRSPEVDDVASISNGQGEIAHLDRTGNVIAWNLPDADGIPVIHELYDAPWRTAFRLGLADKKFSVNRRRQDMSHTLVSTWVNRTGSARERAWMAGFPGSSSYGQMGRLLTCERGTVDARLDLLLRYGHRGEQPVQWEILRGSRPGYTECMAKVGSMKMFLATNMQIEFDDDAISVTGHLALEDGEHAFVWLGWRDHSAPATVEDVEHLLKESEEGWFQWAQALNVPDNEFASLVLGCAIWLRGLGHRAGSFFAAGSRSLPEDDPKEVGVAKRTWDYLFHWLRDGGLTVDALDRLGDPFVLPAILQWYTGLPDLRKKAKIMYGARGQDVALLGEHIVKELGYRNSIFRYGNGAGDQTQYDFLVYVLRHLWLQARRGTVDRDLTLALAEQAKAARFQPCSGVWEVRRREDEEPLVYASAQILNAQAMYYASKIFRIAGMERLAREYEAMAAKVKQWVLDVCVRDGVIMAAPGLHVLDSSILLAILMGKDVFDLKNSDDEQLVRATVYAIDAHADDPNPVRGLRIGAGHVRYHTDEFNDGISLEKEAMFNNVSGWVAQLLLRLGEVERADAVMRELLAARNDLGMWSEERTVDGRSLGNVNQAYVYQVVIDYYLDRAIIATAQARRSEDVAV